MTDEELKQNIESIRADFRKEISLLENRFAVRIDSLLGVLRDFGLTSAEEEPVTEEPKEIEEKAETPKKRNRIRAQVLDEKPNIPSTPAPVAPRFEKRAFSAIFFRNYFDGHIWNKYPVRRGDDAMRNATFCAGNLTESEFLDLCAKFDPFAKAWAEMVKEGKEHMVPGLAKWIENKRWKEDPGQYQRMPQGHSGTAIQGRHGHLGTMYSEALDGAIESPGDTSETLVLSLDNSVDEWEE
jgi:hypothetical protein